MNCSSHRFRQLSFIFLISLYCQYTVYSIHTISRVRSCHRHSKRAILCNSLKNSVDDEIPSSSLRDRRRQKRSGESSQNNANTVELLDAIQNDCLGKPSNENSPLYTTPLEQQLEEINEEHVLFHGFDTLFPNSNLGEFFDKERMFRTAIRMAAREDFFIPDSALTDEANAAIRDPRSTLMGNWKNHGPEFQNLDSVFAKYGITNLNGEEFINALTDLCGVTDFTFGSWIDIIGIKNRKISHSWHQDSGLPQRTVMVGFPPEDNYTGIGVFSHAIKLSHRMPPPLGININEPRLLGNSAQEKYIVRPIYKRGREIMVYDDRNIFHSAPDFAHRESIWRFM